MNPFRERHIKAFFGVWKNQNTPLDKTLQLYFREHKAIGSKDRVFIAETVYHKVRWQRLPEGKDPFDETLSFPERVSVPDDLWEATEKSYGEAKAFEILYALNFPAPTTIRVNPAFTTREELLEKWGETFEVQPTKASPYGIQFQKKAVFFGLPEFKAGWFEVQDEASQLVADRVALNPGDRVMDYCAGSGGKTLAYAHKSEGKGQLYLHDIRPKILYEAKKRLKRAQIQNAQIILPDEKKKLKNLNQKMDWVLVDVPCSGTGTYRRNPDMKWRFTQSGLEELVNLQREIFKKGLDFLKPGGKLVYATCSILKEENEEQVAWFLKEHDLKLSRDVFKSLPEEGGMDGLFGATFENR